MKLMIGNCQYYESKLSAFLHIMGFWGYDNFWELRASKASKDPIIEPSGASSTLHHCRWEQRWGPPGVSLKDRSLAYRLPSALSILLLNMRLTALFPSNHLVGKGHLRKLHEFRAFFLNLDELRFIPEYLFTRKAQVLPVPWCLLYWLVVKTPFEIISHWGIIIQFP
jgi:hypothetical protein